MCLCRTCISVAYVLSVVQNTLQNSLQHSQNSTCLCRTCSSVAYVLSVLYDTLQNSLRHCIEFYTILIQVLVLRHSQNSTCLCRTCVRILQCCYTTLYTSLCDTDTCRIQRHNIYRRVQSVYIQTCIEGRKAILQNSRRVQSVVQRHYVAIRHSIQVYATLIHILQRHVQMFCNGSTQFYRHHRSLCDTYTCSAKTHIHVLQRLDRILLQTLQKSIRHSIYVLQTHVYTFCKDTYTCSAKTLRHCRSLYDTHTCSAKTLIHVLQRHQRILPDTVEFYTTLHTCSAKTIIYRTCSAKTRIDVMQRQYRILPTPQKSIRHLYMFCKEFHKTLEVYATLIHVLQAHVCLF